MLLHSSILIPPARTSTLRHIVGTFQPAYPSAGGAYPEGAGFFFLGKQKGIKQAANNPPAKNNAILNPIITPVLGLLTVVCNVVVPFAKIVVDSNCGRKVSVVVRFSTVPEMVVAKITVDVNSVIGPVGMLVL